ncbi:MAG: hypothetical protein HYV63_19795 [Candidatus Schekmanbacteria bacterium]|nr:hypothetical protein [Candidatus Schekmanbacteria bacterium]
MNDVTSQEEQAWYRRLLAGWKRIAEKMGLVQSAVLLGVVYFAIVGPTAVIALAAGADPLLRRFRSDSYWLPRGEQPPDLERAAKPF